MNVSHDRRLSGWSVSSIRAIAIRVGVVGALALVAIAPLAACSSSPLDSGWSSGSKATAVADWNDVDAAVSVASDKMSFALESSETPDESTRRYRLLTTADEPVDVEVLRGIGGSATGSSFGSGDQRFGPTSLTLRCRVGRFGDERREQQFLNAMRQRLGDLMGVDVAPVR